MPPVRQGRFGGAALTWFEKIVAGLAGERPKTWDDHVPEVRETWPPKEFRHILFAGEADGAHVDLAIGFRSNDDVLKWLRMQLEHAERIRDDGVS